MIGVPAGVLKEFCWMLLISRQITKEKKGGGYEIKEKKERKEEKKQEEKTKRQKREREK